MRNGNDILRTLIASVLMFVAPSLLGAQQPAPPNPLPPGMGQYVMVLWESGTPFPNDPSKTMKVTEPDIASLGGQVISKSANRRVIRLPLAAANGLRHHPSVAYLQRLWMGESFDHWDDGLSETDPPQASASPSRHKTEDDTNLQWGPKAYSYDGSGNISQIGTDHYVYDSAGRLIEAVVNGKTERYSYDAFGNLTQRVVDGANPVNIPVDGESNRISGVIYDVAGNVLNGGDDGRRTYSYDSLNMMTRIRPFGTDRRYIYDANDEQIGMLYPTGGPVTETSRWTFRDFDGHVIREYNVDQFDNQQGGLWRWEQDSFYGEGMLLGGETQAFYFNFNNTTTTWGGKRHYHLDHLGSIRMVTDDMGRSIDEHDYYPFGTSMTRTYQDQFNWSDPHIDAARFAGHRRDFLGSLNVDSTDYLDNMHARYYDPNLGRFLSVDPTIDLEQNSHLPQRWNRYSYTLNDPIRHIDPNGRDTLDPLRSAWTWLAFAVGARSPFTRETAGHYMLSHPGETVTVLTAAGVAVAIVYGPELVGLGGSTAATASGGTVILGENVLERLKPLAEEMNLGTGSTFDAPWKGTVSEMIESNMGWLQSEIDRGARILDIGRDLTRANVSQFYAAEVHLLQENGYTRSFLELRMVNGTVTAVYQWVKGSV